MFSRFVKPLRLQSLTVKLVILYTFSTLGILTALGLFFYSKAAGLSAHLNPDQLLYLRAECYDMVIITFLLGALGAMLFGYVVARRGLSGITLFADKVSQMTAASLHQRLDPSEWPSELKYLGETFNVMLNRLQASFTQLSQFSADIAHELRTPVQHLMGVTELALSKSCTKMTYQQTMLQQMQACQDLAKLIDQLLFLARSDHGQLSLDYERFSAREIVDPILAFYQIWAEEKNIALQCSGDIEISADRHLLKRVLTNLVSNALHYTPANGEVLINMAMKDAKPCITIRDTGIGIPAHHLPKVFDRCYRVDADRNITSGGLGLGLAIVKSIVDLHGGTLHIMSEVQKGTTIQLLLPSPA